jgi:hypothetical protein
MIGDFFREVAVLVTVFFPLEFALKDGQGKVSLVFLIVVSCVALSSLMAGIVFEKMRGR